jgi:hypothetical protein
VRTNVFSDRKSGADQARGRVSGRSRRVVRQGVPGARSAHRPAGTAHPQGFSDGDRGGEGPASNLESGQRCPQTDVRSAAEGQVRVLLAADIEPTGSIEHRFVSIGRRVPQPQLLTLSNANAGQFGVGRRNASELHKGGTVSQDLISRSVRPRRFLPQTVTLAGVLDEQEQGMGQGVARGFIATDEEQYAEETDLQIGQSRPAHFGQC